MTFRSKMIASYLACGILPVLAASLLICAISSRGLNNLQDHVNQGLYSTAQAKLRAQYSLKRSHVEDYFAQIRDQVITFAEDGMVVHAMRSFRTSFATYRHEAGIDDTRLEELGPQLQSYYTGDFSRVYAEQNPDMPLDTTQLLEPLDPDSIALQHAYISNNSNPLGSKHLLNESEHGTQYDRLHSRIHPIVRDYLEKFGYYDIFLVDAETGDIVYSVFKELDFTTSLLDGPYAETNFGECFRLARKLPKGQFAIVDFEQYTPSYEAPASFIASPIYDGSELIGVAMFQMPVDRIVGIFSNREGLGETGETVVVGSEHRMRSNSHLDSEFHNLVQSFKDPERGSINTADVDRALQGETGVMKITDYRGIETISAYGPIDFLGLRWALAAKIDQSEVASSITDSAKSTESNIWLVTIVSLLGGALISSLLGWTISRWFSKSLLEVNGIAESVAAASRQLAKATADLSSGAQDQADSLKRTAASLEEMTSTIQQNADNAQQANEQSLGSRDVAERGGLITQRAVDGMSEINQSSRKIAAIISTIDEIAFQTNLLALNASIEAARAGAQGRGFAVVAGEVRNLAQRSARAANEITELIDNSVSKVETGSVLVTQSGTTLNEIVSSVKRVTDIISEIAVASRQQAGGIEQVNLSVNSMERVIQANVTQTESLTSTAQTLASQARQLQRVVDQFDLKKHPSQAPQAEEQQLQESPS
ncbi:methyl-accepting chemotaxis protein [Aeoliella mucimassa]|uniref:Methyl-accepting chemotaxis protein II n=1 Tax=Aeoliella mucimassa TaxID=2527972 RepID=A0A518ALB6_9BACT|nr:methyl-accepting chemotaxis protein [Aeoliella mucimassa]QDU55523.1 Methyl-accepting chemotaxis protein II [Aeoliella mucimassa]